MEDEKKKIDELFRSNTYFQQSLEWYTARYVTPRTQIVLASFFAIIAFSAFVISIIAFFKIFPLSERTDLFIYRPINVAEKITIQPMGKGNEEATMYYLKYLLKEYTISREEYVPTKLESNFNLVVELSSDAEFLEYQAIADPEQNPNHPVWEYGSQATKKITVKKVTLTDLDEDLENYDNGTDFTAKVEFENNVVFIDSNKQNSKSVAEIKFQFKPILVDQETNAINQLPKLIITDYKLK